MDELTVFKLIKLLDRLQDFSKKDVVNEYESYDDEVPEMILNKSIYPNGDSLGFYNYSEYDLSKLSEISEDEIKDEFLDYIDSYSENVYEVLDSLNIEEIINSLSNKELLSQITTLTHDNSDDFLSSLISQIILPDNSFSISNSYGDEFLALQICLKAKELNPNLDVKLPCFNEIFNLNNGIVNDNYSIANMAFAKDENTLKEIISNFNSDKLFITLSSSFFDDNINILNNIPNPHNIDAIISLPIFEKTDNLILLVLNSNKNSSQFIFIDESESLIHKNSSLDYSLAENELIPRIIDSYKNYLEYENSLVLPIESLITKPLNNFNKFVIEEKEDYSKKRVLANELSDRLLSIKEEESLIKNEMVRHNIRGVENNEAEVFTFNSSSSTFDNLFYSKKRPSLENLLYKNEKRLIDEDVKFVNLGDIADLKSISQKNDKNTILIATCKQCDSKLVYYNHDIEDFKDQIYIEIDNISSDFLKEYLYVYLNSFNGHDEIQYFSKRNYLIKTEQMGFVKIPKLSIKTQLEIIDAVHESEEFFKTIDLLKKDFQSNILDYKHVMESINELRGDIEFGNHAKIKITKSMEHAYNGLIWPLASSYLYATKGGFESVEKKDNYLVLFEFIAAFNFIILLSGLPNRVYQKYKWDIWNARNKNIYKDMTFGKWVKLSENISKIYEENNFTRKLDEELFEKISSRKILKLLDKTKEYRNIEFHGAYSNKYEADKILQELNVYLDEIFEILEVYSNYRLFYVLGNNGDSHRIISLNGPCAPPIYDTIELNERLQKDCLYLYNPRNNNKLLIKDNFMKFVPIDDDKKYWALFIYDSCDYHEFYASYKCYQSNEEALKCHIYDFKEDILG